MQIRRLRIAVFKRFYGNEDRESHISHVVMISHVTSVAQLSSYYFQLSFLERELHAEANYDRVEVLRWCIDGLRTYVALRTYHQ